MVGEPVAVAVADADLPRLVRRAGRVDVHHRVGDEIDHVHFKLRSVEQLQTPLGCMQLYNVEKVRDPTSKRYTRTYYAAEYGFAPVVIEHGKHGDEDWRGQVVALSLDGQPVEAKPPCPP